MSAGTASGSASFCSASLSSCKSASPSSTAVSNIAQLFCVYLPEFRTSADCMACVSPAIFAVPGFRFPTAFSTSIAPAAISCSLAMPLSSICCTFAIASSSCAAASSVAFVRSASAAAARMSSAYFFTAAGFSSSFLLINSSYALLTAVWSASLSVRISSALVRAASNAA